MSKIAPAQRITIGKIIAAPAMAKPRSSEQDFLLEALLGLLEVLDVGVGVVVATVDLGSAAMVAKTDGSNVMRLEPLLTTMFVVIGASLDAGLKHCLSLSS